MTIGPSSVYASILSCLMILMLCSCISNSTSDDDSSERVNKIVGSVHEVDSRFAMKAGREITFSMMDDGKYCLFQQSLMPAGKASKISQDVDRFHPLYLNDSIWSLSDNNGDEQFIAASVQGGEKKLENTIKDFSASQSGNFGLLEFINEEGLFLYNAKTKELTLLDIDYKTVNGCSFSMNDSWVTVSHDDRLYLYDIRRKLGKYILESFTGKKLNPYIFENVIYFVSDIETENYALYSVNYLDNSTRPLKVLSCEYDIRQPKRIGDDIYFIEIRNSRYLLSTMRVGQDTRQLLTNKGVIYDYQIAGDNNIIASYSDRETPKTIIKIDLRAKNVVNLANNSILNDFVFSQNTYEGTPYYSLTKAKERKKRGIIVYIHPGVNLDFSPRWETTLMTLCDLGFDIYAPNYPGSSGYGKAFANAPISQAADGIQRLTRMLINTHSGIPVYFLAFSSGSVLMDMVLADDIGVNGAISVMGIPSNLDRKRCPSLFFLGRNDPVIPYSARAKALRKIYSNDAVYSFDDEGHWVRKPENTATLIRMINVFAKKNS